MCEDICIYIFGYGSLIWRPGFPYLRKFNGYIRGWKRVFWQGSTDHRGTTEAPGRVVTLIKDTDGSKLWETWGVVYCVPDEQAEGILKNLDYREKGGYVREELDIYIRGHDTPVVKGAVTYIATEANKSFLGDASIEEIARQIYRCVGPSGPNVDYLFNLADRLRKMEVVDEHVFELEQLVRSYITSAPLAHHALSSTVSHTVAHVLTHNHTVTHALSHTTTRTTAVDFSTNSVYAVNGASTRTDIIEVKDDLQRKYFLSPNADIKGIIYVDAGAVQAISQRGRSLLAAGIVAVKGNFGPQELVSVVDTIGTEISRGISNYGSDEICKIKGVHSTKISEILGFTRGAEVLHHHNMILV